MVAVLCTRAWSSAHPGQNLPVLHSPHMNLPHRAHAARAGSPWIEQGQLPATASVAVTAGNQSLRAASVEPRCGARGRRVRGWASPFAGGLVEDRDAEQLGLLSAFHYVVAAMSALCWGTFPILHLSPGLMFRHFPQSIPSSPGHPPPPPEALQMFQLFGTFFVVFAAGLIVAGWAYAIAMLLAGNYLRRRAHYTYCFTLAAISCLFMPFGTVLGVFTLVVLNRPSVRALFAAGRADAGG